jgi:hypothetical protein
VPCVQSVGSHCVRRTTAFDGLMVQLCMLPVFLVTRPRQSASWF